MIKNIITFFVIGMMAFNVVFAQETTEKKKKEKKEKQPKTEKTTSTDESSEEGDKSLGVVFDGASIFVSAGLNYYMGDIAAYKFFPRPRQFKNHFTGGFKASIARDIKWGLGAQLNYQRGSLIGTRKTGKNSSTVSFENQYFDMSFQVRYLLNKALFKKNEYNRFYIYGSVGFGSMWYRSRLYDTETLNTKDFEGWVEVDNTKGLAQKTLSDKVPRAKTWTIPYGLTVNYRYNYKIDIHLDITQTSTFTDRLDAFNRSWTAYDKYNYIGLGITYNFNRTKDDAPKKREKVTKNDTETSDSNSNDEIKSSIFSRNKSNKSKKSSSKDDELLNIRLKLFETQLKLFEMQYLLGQ
ncbi:MAG: hypothetical protein K0B10_06555 [Vicingaceae bacterium]|nr:hypothetical protein [Vicingaceae bacterium]